MAGFFHRVTTGRPLLTIGARPEPPTVIPDGFDALLHSSQGATWLSTRTIANGTAAAPLRGTPAAQRLLGDLGAQGLTSVYLPSDDPLATRFVRDRRKTTGSSA
jgi:hypothetical protein